MVVNHPGGPTASKVLIVDDEAPVRKLVIRLLDAAGFDCDQAATLDEAWSHLSENETAVVILDIQLPSGSGLTFLSRIKETYPDTEVVMLTGIGDTKTAIRALSSGAAGYLIKPMENNELLFKVRKAIEHRQLLLERRDYTRRLEERVREQTVSIQKAHEGTIHRLVTASMYRDEETGAHIRRVGRYSELMAEALGWGYEDVERIRMAAPMHDIGKIGIPDAILQKPGALTSEEFEVMKQHTVIGASMLAGSDFPVLDLARAIALAHHERWDGRGYPNGVAGDNISEAARIVAIVDFYDALTHDRVYRPALSEEAAIDLIEKGRATHFDPFLVGVFLSLLPEMRRIGLELSDDASHDQKHRGAVIPPLDSDARSPEIVASA